jgi:hypothetical protein
VSVSSVASRVLDSIFACMVPRAVSRTLPSRQSASASPYLDLWGAYLHLLRPLAPDLNPHDL